MITDEYIDYVMENVSKCVNMVWYNASRRVDKEDFTEVIKQMIDAGYKFEFNKDYTKFRKFEVEF